MLNTKHALKFLHIDGLNVMKLSRSSYAVRWIPIVHSLCAHLYMHEPCEPALKVICMGRH